MRRSTPGRAAPARELQPRDWPGPAHSCARVHHKCCVTYRPVSLRDAQLREGLPAAAAAAQELAAHRASAERMLAELRAGSALRHCSQPAQRVHVQRRGISTTFTARRVPVWAEDGRCAAMLQPVTPEGQWMLAPSPL